MSFKGTAPNNQANGSGAVNRSQVSSVIRAELEGSRRCSALGVEVDAHAPFLALARNLILVGFDPSCILEAYRGATLCLRAGLDVAAELTVEDDRNGTPRFRRDRVQSVVAAPPATPTGWRAIQHLTPSGAMPYGGEP
jgi:hypothetical protein